MKKSPNSIKKEDALVYDATIVNATRLVMATVAFNPQDIEDSIVTSIKAKNHAELNSSKNEQYKQTAIYLKQQQVILRLVKNFITEVQLSGITKCLEIPTSPE